MPFGLDLKSILVGIILGMFVIPWLRVVIGDRASASASQ